jgi:hypothetical protein
MERIRHLIAKKELEFSKHPFFARLKRDAPYQATRGFAPQLTFWVFSFQDVLRLNEQRVVDKKLRALVRQHAREDSGHERWFLNDVAGIEGAMPTLLWVFSSQHASTRDTGYALMSEVFRAQHDAERIALLLALESAAHAFFPQVSRYLQRHGQAEGMRYFSGMHLDAEDGHELFEAEMDAVINALSLNGAEYDAALALVERVFAAFHAMFDGIETSLCAEQLDSASMTRALKSSAQPIAMDGMKRRSATHVIVQQPHNQARGCGRGVRAQALRSQDG